MNGKSIFPLLALFTLMGSQAVSAEVYKWVDEQGNVHFGDKPKGKISEKLDLKTDISEARRRDAQLINQQYQQLYDDYRREDAAKLEVKTREKQRKQKMQKECSSMQKHVNTANQEYAFYDVNEKGEKEYLTDEQIKAYRDKLNKAYKSKCGDI